MAANEDMPRFGQDRLPRLPTSVENDMALIAPKLIWRSPSAIVSYLEGQERVGDFYLCDDLPTKRVVAVGITAVSFADMAEGVMPVLRTYDRRLVEAGLAQEQMLAGFQLSVIRARLEDEARPESPVSADNLFVGELDIAHRAACLAIAEFIDRYPHQPA